MFSVTGSSVVVTIDNLTVKGGDTANYTDGAITVANGATLHFNGSAIANSRNSAAGGGGLYNNGTTYFTNSRLMRNSATYGGGFLNLGTMYVEGSTVIDNRSESATGGGGAGQNNATLYINNSTFSNNKSTEIGGAINNNGGTLYALNSTFSGNVGYGTLTAGGAIGNNGGAVTVINSLFAYNYVRSGGTVASPTSYALDDVSKYSGSGTTNSYYCIFQGPTTGHNVKVSNVSYSGLADGSDNAIFAGGTLTQITDGTGAAIGSGQVFQPFLVSSSNTFAALLQPAGFAQTNLGSQSGFSSSGTPIVGYYNIGNTAWVTIAGSSPEANIVGLDQLGATRLNPPMRGAVEASASNLYMLKVNATANGTVNGGSLYGDIYPASTQVVLTPIPNSGFQFVKWNDTGGNQVSTSNPYTVTVNSDITLVPVFSVQTGGQYTITYIGNNNTGGTVPATNTYSASTTIANSGTLVNAGNTFAGWNTSSNGSGTPYLANDTYSAGTNLTLYAQWTANIINGTCAVSSLAVATVPTGVAACTSGSLTNAATTASQFTWGCAGSGGGTSTSATACNVPRGYNVTPNSPTGGTVNPSIAQVVAYNTTTNFTLTGTGSNVVSSASGCGGSFGGTVNVSTSGTFTTAAITADCAVSASFVANAAPSVSAVAITGTAQVGTQLNGSYTYADANNDAQGTSTFRWVSNTASTGVTGGVNVAATQNYTPVSGDQGKYLFFCVTPVATTSTSPGTEVCSNATALIPAVVNGTCAVSSLAVATVPTGVSACTLGSLTNAATTASQFTWGCAGSGGGTSTSATACNVPRGYNVTPSAGANGSITPNTVQVVGYNTPTSFTITPNAGYKSNVASTCGGGLTGTTYTTSVITSACAVDATFTPTTSQTNIPTRQSGVTATLSVIGCTAVGSTVFLDAPATGKPASKAFPYGLVDFTLTGCVGMADVTITYSQPIPAGATYYKEANGTYSTMAATIGSNTVHFTLTDNGTGDADNTIGIIRDPSGLAFDLAAGVSSIPTLSEWGLLILSALMVLFGIRRTRRLGHGAI